MFDATQKFFATLSLLVLFGCGGGGGGGSPVNTTTGFQQTFTASATAGELLTYTIDTQALTYSYTITKSSYGCDVSTSPCHTGSGSLVKNADGTYSPSTSPSSKLYALQNGLLAGSVALSFNGVSQRVPILGVSNPATTTADLAGDYNFLSLQCTTKSYGVLTGCSTYQGTLRIASNGTYSTCSGADITNQSPNCNNTTSGTVTSLGGGIWTLQATSPAQGQSTNYFLAFKAPNGQKVGIIDFNDSVVYGYGQGIGSSRVATTTSDTPGTYVWSNSYGSSGTVIVKSDNTTDSGLTITQNSPWDGIATVSGGGVGNGYAVLAGNGVYAYRNPNVPNRPAYFEVGMKLQ